MQLRRIVSFSPLSLYLVCFFLTIHPTGRGCALQKQAAVDSLIGG